MTSIAPGSVKLFGEHAVVYGRVGVSASLDRYASVTVLPSGHDCVEIFLPDLGFSRALGEEELDAERRTLDFIFERNEERRLRELRKGNFALPFSYIISSVFLRTGFKPLKIEVRSQVPRYSGLGSSSSIFTALASELNAHFGLKFGLQEIAELANLGDMVVHGTPSGIDASTCAQGGFLRFRRGEELKKVEAKGYVHVAVVNTNLKKETGEMIAKVAELRKRDPTGTDGIFDDMQEAAFAGLDALKDGDMVKLGAEFDRAQACFGRLGLNTKETDEIVRVAKKHVAYGAKISGAGGGGCVIALAKEPAKLIPLFEKLGYPSFISELGVEGVKHGKFDKMV